MKAEIWYMVHHVNLISLGSFLPYRLAVVARRISNALSRRYSRHGITAHEWRIMAHLAEHAPCSSGQLGNNTALDKATVNRAVMRLVASGLVSSAVSSVDARLNVLNLSERGSDIYHEIAPVALDFQEMVFGALSSTERRVLFEMLERLDDKVQDIEAGEAKGSSTK